jgi:hypothetical protein
MNVASAERLARRLHQGEIDGNGAAYVDHLARVAALVAAEGGSRAQLMAAWLGDQARRDIPAGRQRGTPVHAAANSPSRKAAAAPAAPSRSWRDGHQDEFLRATAVRGLAGLHGDHERLSRSASRASSGQPKAGAERAGGERA